MGKYISIRNILRAVTTAFLTGGLIGLFANLVMTEASAADAPKVKITGVPGSPDATASPNWHRFELYKTENIYTLLLLDTQTGRIWQAQYATDDKSFRGVIPISTKILAQGQSGTFTLTKSENMWTFILTDTMNGRLWQCQFAIGDSQNRFCIPIPQPDDVSFPVK